MIELTSIYNLMTKLAELAKPGHESLNQLIMFLKKGHFRMVMILSAEMTF